MKTYGQFCPIARVSEVLAERWTPTIIRKLHRAQEQAEQPTFPECL